MKWFKKVIEKGNLNKNHNEVLYPDYIDWYNPTTYGHPMIDEQWDNND